MLSDEGYIDIRIVVLANGQNPKPKQRDIHRNRLVTAGILVFSLGSLDIPRLL